MFQQDKTKAKEALAREEQKKSQIFGPRVKFWNPKEGDNPVRIMPPWTDAGANKFQCWREVYEHWDIGAPNSERKYVCSVKTPDAPPGTPCAVCQLVDHLRSTKDPVDNEKAGDLRAKQRFYSSVVDLKDPVYTKHDVDEWAADAFNKGKECTFKVGDTKVQLYSYGTTVFNPLLTLVSDESVNVLSFDEGYNIIIKRVGKTKNNTEYSVRPDFKQSVFKFISDLPVAQWLPNLDAISLLQLPDPNDVQKSVMEMTAGAAPISQPPLGAGRMAPGLPAAGGHQETPAPRAPVSLPQVEEEKPPCFADKEIHSDADAECVGGKKIDPDTKREQTYDPCPVFAACKTAIFGVAETPPPRRGRRPVAAATDAVASLEAQMRGELTGKK